MARADPETLLRQRTRVSALADVYGPLLTGRQRDMLRLYYAEDWSLAEVAERSGVSRQAVHDLLRRAIGALEGYEARLGWVQRTAKDRACLEQVGELLDRAAGDPAGQRALAAARDLVRRLAED